MTREGCRGVVVVVLVGTVALLLAAIACGRGPSAPSSPPRTTVTLQIKATVPDNPSIASELEATFPDGTVARDWASYANKVQTVAASASIEADVELYSVNRPVVRPFSDFPSEHKWDIKGILGRYFWRVSGESGPIGGCIGQSNAPHFGLLIRDIIVNREVTNIHLASWAEGSRRCFGVYNSANGWCKRICGPNREQMQGLLAEALVAAGIGATTAYILSQIAIPMVAGALLL
jgi:hypothetical protein